MSEAEEKPELKITLLKSGSAGRRPAAGVAHRRRKDQCADFLLGPDVGPAARRRREGAAASGDALQRPDGHQPFVGRFPDLLAALYEDDDYKPVVKDYKAYVERVLK